MITGAWNNLNVSGYLYPEKDRNMEPDPTFKRVNHNVSVEKRFDNAEEAALWLEDMGYVVEGGQIRRHNTKISMTRQEREVIIWLTDIGYEWIGDAADLLVRDPAPAYPHARDVLSAYGYDNGGKGKDYNNSEGIILRPKRNLNDDTF